MQAGRIGKPVDGFDHVKVTTTLKIYTHQFKMRDAAAASMMGNLVESALRVRNPEVTVNPVAKVVNPEVATIKRPTFTIIEGGLEEKYG